MNFNPLEVFAGSLPAVALSLLVIAVLCSRLKQLIWKPKHPQKRRGALIRSCANVALGAALLPFVAIYRPSLAEVIKAEIRQQEDADEDDNGDPESPLKHLFQQLRRIRRGENVETLSLRLK